MLVRGAVLQGEDGVGWAALGPWATASRDRGLGVGLLIEVRKDHGPAARVMRQGRGDHEDLVERFDQRAAKSSLVAGCLCACNLLPLFVRRIAGTCGQLPGVGWGHSGAGSGA